MDELRSVLQAVLRVALSDGGYPGRDVDHLSTGGACCHDHPPGLDSLPTLQQHPEEEYLLVLAGLLRRSQPGGHDRNDPIHRASYQDTVQAIPVDLATT